MKYNSTLQSWKKKELIASDLVNISNKILIDKGVELVFLRKHLIDKKLQVMPPVPRTRTFDPVHVRCRVCGKEEDVNPTLVSEINRYKCNSCAMTGG